MGTPGCRRTWTPHRPAGRPLLALPGSCSGLPASGTREPGAHPALAEAGQPREAEKVPSASTSEPRLGSSRSRLGPGARSQRAGTVPQLPSRVRGRARPYSPPLARIPRWLSQRVARPELGVGGAGDRGRGRSTTVAAEVEKERGGGGACRFRAASAATARAGRPRRGGFIAAAAPAPAPSCRPRPRPAPPRVPAAAFVCQPAAASLRGDCRPPPTPGPRPPGFRSQGVPVVGLRRGDAPTPRCGARGTEMHVGRLGVYEKRRGCGDTSARGASLGCRAGRLHCPLGETGAPQDTVHSFR